MSLDVSRPLIIVAEDSAELRTLVATGLERVGFRVVQAENGKDLVAETRRVLVAGEEGGIVALIVTDDRMPTLGGVAAVALLREAGFAMPVIFMTAFADQKMRIEAARLGAVVLSKPIGLKSLREAVANALGTATR